MPRVPAPLKVLLLELQTNHCIGEVFMPVCNVFNSALLAMLLVSDQSDMNIATVASIYLIE